jgi:hypothetical protein
MSAISTKRRTHFKVLTDTFDPDVMRRFLGRLAGHFTRKARLVADGHSVTAPTRPAPGSPIS